MATPADQEVDGKSIQNDDVYRTAVIDLRKYLTCEICMRLLHEPFTTSCGHTFCYECLNTWVKDNDAAKPCPSCRTRIKYQPAQAYAIRDMVLRLCADDRLLPQGEGKEEQKKMQEEMNSLLEKHRGPGGLGLFEGRFNILARPDAIFDEADGVWRCPRDQCELDDGVCLNCDWAFDIYGRPADADNSDSDYEDDRLLHQQSAFDLEAVHDTTAASFRSALEREHQSLRSRTHQTLLRTLTPFVVRRSPPVGWGTDSDDSEFEEEDQDEGDVSDLIDDEESEDVLSARARTISTSGDDEDVEQSDDIEQEDENDDIHLAVAEIQRRIQRRIATGNPRHFEESDSSLPSLPEDRSVDAVEELSNANFSDVVQSDDDETASKAVEKQFNDDRERSSKNADNDSTQPDRSSSDDDSIQQGRQRSRKRARIVISDDSDDEPEPEPLPSNSARSHKRQRPTPLSDSDDGGATDTSDRGSKDDAGVSTLKISTNPRRRREHGVGTTSSASSAPLRRRAIISSDEEDSGNETDGDDLGDGGNEESDNDEDNDDDDDDEPRLAQRSRAKQSGPAIIKLTRGTQQRQRSHDPDSFERQSHGSLSENIRA